MHICNAVVKKV